MVVWDACGHTVTWLTHLCWSTQWQQKRNQSAETIAYILEVKLVLISIGIMGVLSKFPPSIVVLTCLPFAQPLTNRFLLWNGKQPKVPKNSGDSSSISAFPLSSMASFCCMQPHWLPLDWMSVFHRVLPAFCQAAECCLAPFIAL